MIPKVIHYCWFGGNSLGDRELKCIDSWKKFLPGYEIIQWNESNFDLSCCAYVQEAHKAGKWAFVSDYARFKIIFERGGLYFDTDVEAIASFDNLLEEGPFMGFESDPSERGFMSVNSGLGFAAPAGLDIFRIILNSYEADHFLLEDGNYNYQTVVERVTNILVNRGLKAIPGIQQVEGISIYPSEYLNPTNLQTGELCVTSQTRSVHHYGASWQPASLRRIGLLKQEVNRRMPLMPKAFRSAFAWIKYLLDTGDFAAFKNRY